MKKQVLFVATILATINMNAQQIDFDMSNRSTAEVTADGYTSWMVNQAPSDTMNIDNITIKAEATAEANVLRAQWSKNDIKKSAELKLTGDAVVAFINEDGNTPVQTAKSLGIKFTISGLSAGKHTIQAYHNGVNGLTNLAPIDIYVNDVKVASNVPQSENAQSKDAASLSYITVNAEEGKDIVVEYRTNPASGTTYGATMPYINALIFDKVNTESQAQAPVPTTGDFHVNADNGSYTLSFTPAADAVKHHIYLGTDPESLSEVSSNTLTSYTLTDLTNLKTYYWRVDEENANGNITTGEVWSFRPRHLAFPGAEGYGKYAIGGRGGSVYHVTNLEDNGDDTNPIEGSFRYGIKKIQGPRTIVFDVSGIISLKSRLTCSDPYVTIAGQTAPGNGIMLRTSPFGMATDGITRFLRMRLGHKELVNGVIPDDRNGETYGNKAGTSDEYIVSGIDGMGMAGNTNAIMDHCSISWTIDEAFSSRSAQSITLQRTLISEALNEAGHPNYGKGTRHGYAATIGGGEMSKDLTVGSYHHNLLAHCEGRNWSISGGLDGVGAYDGHHDIFNNVVYNWGGRASDGGSHEINFVSNFYKMGPATTQSKLIRLQLEGKGSGTQSVYVNGNVRQAANNGSLTADKEGNTYQYEADKTQTVDWNPLATQPFFESLATIEDVKSAYKNVLSDVGANQPFFDVHDQRMVKETINGTYTVTGSRSGKKGLPDSEEDAGCEGFNGLNMIEESRPADFDTDGDGMPDWWENATGMTDANGDDNNDGFTNLEDYLNWMAEPHFNNLNTIELKPYFAGYNNNPSFSVIESKGVDAKINGTTLELAPAANGSNLATVVVEATDEDGWGSYKRTFHFAISESTGINIIRNTKTLAQLSEETFNLAGQRVNKDYKGIVIKQGKKYTK